jgi:tetratricopeptide (TPR) repeat protein
MTTAPPVPPAEDTPRDGLVQMSGTSHDASTLNQVAGDQYNIHLPPTPPAPATCTLPADTAAFTGRGKELHDITTAVTAAAEAGRVVAIHALDGMPGVGKTALAVHVGHRLADRFPDRQLFLDLHAHTACQEPMTPQAALASLLTADGADTRYLPESLEERATLWRDRMAHKQVLLILDNAASSGQVTPLLPGSAGCLVLVTSRRYLGDLPGAVPMLLDILPPDEAQQMFLLLAPRAATEPAKVAELVALCGHLPLAISLRASLFSKHRSWTMGHLISETKTSLLTVAVENHTVAAAFDLSYQDLPTDRQRFFRRLGLHPGVDLDAYAAAALAGIPLEQASEHLDALYSDRLLDEPVYRRYRMHDLIRDYARTLAATDPADERDQALSRLLDYYQHTAALADAHLTRLTRPPAATLAAPPGAAPRLTSRNQALDWLRTERANLLACRDHATHHAEHARVVGLTASVASLLRNDGPWTQALELHAQAATAARRLGDQLGEAYTLTELGVVRWLTGDYPGAAQVLEQALTLHHDLDNRHGEATALTELGVVRRLTGDYPGAAQVLEQALTLHHDLDNRHGEAYTLTELGVVRRLTGDYPGAIQVLDQALHLHHDLSNQLGEADALTSLGLVRFLTDDYPGAAQMLEQALSLYRDLGDRLGEAEVLNHGGTLHRMLGDPEQALAHYQRALELAYAVDSPLEQARALEGAGRCALARGDTAAAVTQLRQALEIYQRIGAAEATQLATDLADLDAE